MAHQLQAQGQEVAFLAMLDIVPELYENLVPESMAAAYETYASKYFFKRYKDQIADKTVVERMIYIGQGLLRKAAIHLHDMAWRMSRQDAFLSKFFHNVESTNILAFKRYTPRPYEGDVTLFQSREVAQTCGVQDWSGLAHGETTVQLISDGGTPNIGRMFKEPCVQNLARMLADSLSKGHI
jgi:thioesterase domain-containing protein